MNNVPASPKNNRLIKSLFGFFLGAICTLMGVTDLSKELTLSSFLSTLAFLCFWYLWSQTIAWNQSMKHFFTANKQEMSRFSTYLSLSATALLLSAVLVKFIH